MKCIVVNLNKNRWLCATVDNLTQVMKLGSWTFCGHVIQFEIQPVNIPQMPPAPICGVWMTLKPPGSQEKVIFIQYFWGSLVSKLCTTSNRKITLGRFLLSLRMSFTKQTNDHVVYFF
jgi:hypothetical protein